MTRTRKCNVRLTRTPEVEARTYSMEVRIKTGSFRGNTEFNCEGDLSMECATRLVRELRKALRQIRDEGVRRLNRVVEHAEGEL